MRVRALRPFFATPPRRRGGHDLSANAEEMTGIDAQRAKYAKLFAKGVDKNKGRWRGGHILGGIPNYKPTFPGFPTVVMPGSSLRGS